MSSLSEWLKRIEGNSLQSVDLGLDRVGEVYQRMGSPRPASSNIVIAGTNGKGSTQAALRVALETLGKRVGLYSSPHLLHFNERYRICGELVSDGMLCKAFEHIVVAQQDIRLTYFEYATLAAFELMSRADLDYSILEVGLGGRLDAVNLIDADVSIITSIDIDHTEWLGNNRECIAREKAGVMRPGQKSVCGDPNPPVTLGTEAERIGASIEFVGIDFTLTPQSDGTLLWRDDTLGKPHLNPYACAAALRTVELLDLPITDAVLRAVESKKLAGRTQTLCIQERTWLLDVAHNPASAGLLASHLKEISAQHPDARIWAAYGSLKDKDVEALLVPFAHMFQGVAAMQLDSPRSFDCNTLRAKISTCDIPVLAAFDSCAAALDALGEISEKGDIIAVFGSFFAVSEAMQHLDAIPLDTEVS